MVWLLVFPFCQKNHNRYLPQNLLLLPVALRFLPPSVRFPLFLLQAQVQVFGISFFLGIERLAVVYVTIEVDLSLNA